MSNDRIVVIKIENSGACMFVIGVYLPQQQCYISNFAEYADKLQSVIVQCKYMGDVIIIGDFNCQFGNEFGYRGTGKTTRNVRYFNHTVIENNLNVVDLQESCSGPNYTY